MLATWNGESEIPAAFVEEFKDELEKNPELQDVSWTPRVIDDAIGMAHCMFHEWDVTPEQFVMAAKQLLAEGSLEENNVHTRPV